MLTEKKLAKNKCFLADTTYKKGEKGNYQFIAKPSKWKEFKAKLKYLIKKTILMSFDERVTGINRLVRG